MSESEIHLLLDYARDTEYYALFYTALFIGMRRGELLALRSSNVDLDFYTISITHSLEYNRHENRVVIGECKTPTSRRLVDLSPSTVSVLREHYLKQTELRKQLCLPITDDTLVFSHFDGSPLLPNSVSHAWIKLVRQCGLNGIRLHDARHTHASLLLKQGTHPKIVQERLGHSSIELTLDTYSHVVPGLQQAAANRFDDMMYKESEIPDREITR